MKNGKSFIVALVSMLLTWLVTTISIAEQRMITFEMGESGHFISFPMSQKEILAAEKIDKAIEEIEQRKLDRKKIWVESYVRAESGATINFPMSEEEIGIARAQREKLAKNHDEFSQLQQELEKRFEVFEMGDGGQSVKFKWDSSQ